MNLSSLDLPEASLPSFPSHTFHKKLSVWLTHVAMEGRNREIGSCGLSGDTDLLRCQGQRLLKGEIGLCYLFFFF